MAPVRLQVVLARAGLGSRRACEELVRQGLVRVNGHVVTELGTKVDEAEDRVTFRGRVVGRPQEHRYVALNKPREVVSTVTDPQGRRTVIDLVPWVRERVYPVGRLDYHSEGLLLLTNDGDLTERLTHPRHGVEKVYLAKVRGTPDAAARERLERGIVLDGRRTGPVQLRPARRPPSTGRRPKGKSAPGGPSIRDEDGPGASWVEVTVTEGRYHLVRDALLRVGHPVLRLRRVAFGPVRLGKLAPGESRDLDPSEVESLRRAAAGLAVRPVQRRGRGARGSAAPRAGTAPARRAGTTPVPRAGKAPAPRASTASTPPSVGAASTPRRGPKSRRRESP